MKVLVHLGTHKTGTTTLQKILRDNHHALAENGIWYECGPDFDAHHHAAWQLMRGESDLFDQMIANAKRHECHTLITSSEEYGYVLYNADYFEMIRKACAAQGIADLEWHVVIREPGDLFASLYAELQKHFFQDLNQMYYDVCKRGYVHIERPHLDIAGDPGTSRFDGTTPPYSHFGFDQFNDLRAFQALIERRAGGVLFVHDFADQDPFPGWRMLSRLGVLEVIRYDISAENTRGARDRIIRSANLKIDRILAGSNNKDRLSRHFAETIDRSHDMLDMYRSDVAARFRDSHIRALALAQTGGAPHDPDRPRRIAPASRARRLARALKYLYRSVR